MLIKTVQSSAKDDLQPEACNLKSKVNLRLASATWVLSSNSLVLAHTVKYYNQEATRFGLFTLHQASALHSKVGALPACGLHDETQSVTASRIYACSDSSTTGERQ
jgi:hypothetical protein